MSNRDVVYKKALFIFRGGNSLHVRIPEEQLYELVEKCKQGFCRGVFCSLDHFIDLSEVVGIQSTPDGPSAQEKIAEIQERMVKYCGKVAESLDKGEEWKKGEEGD